MSSWKRPITTSAFFRRIVTKMRTENLINDRIQVDYIDQKETEHITNENFKIFSQLFTEIDKTVLHLWIVYTDHDGNPMHFAPLGSFRLNSGDEMHKMANLYADFLNTTYEYYELNYYSGDFKWEGYTIWDSDDYEPIDVDTPAEALHVFTDKLRKKTVVTVFDHSTHTRKDYYGAKFISDMQEERRMLQDLF